MPASSVGRGRLDEIRLQDTIPPALEEIEARGNVLRLIQDRSERLALMKAMADLGLVVWNRPLSKYELTRHGQESLARYLDKIAAGQLRVMRG